MSDITEKAAATIKSMVRANEQRRGLHFRERQAKYNALADRAALLAHNFARIDPKFDQVGFIKACGIEYQTAKPKTGRGRNR